jgi:hypothetical protein
VHTRTTADRLRQPLLCTPTCLIDSETRDRQLANRNVDAHR